MASDDISSKPRLGIFKADDQTQLIKELLERQEQAIEQLDELDERVMATIELVNSSRKADQPAA